MPASRTVAAAVAGGAVGATLIWIFQGNALRLVPEKMTYAELTAVMLAAVSVLVTILGVVVAILAVWGYSNFKGIAESSARLQVSNEIESGRLKGHLEESVTSFMQREFADAGKLRRLLEEQIDRIIISGPGQRAKEESEDEHEADVEI